MPDLHSSISYALRWCHLSGVDVPFKVLASAARLGIKTEEYFGRTLDRLTRSLYEGSIDELEFVQVFEDLLHAQLRAAWLEGMGDNGLSEDDMTPDFERELANMIAEQDNYVLDFADAIRASAAENATTENHKAGLDALLTRADLWQGQYTTIANYAKVYTADMTQRYRWKQGDTKEPCDECSALDGWVATAKEWFDSGYLYMPNTAFGCGRWPGHCACTLEATDEKSMGAPSV